jgi:Ca2+-binding EF-hand superfamily protein
MGGTGSCLHQPGSPPCTEGLFKYVDTDRDGTVSFNEIHEEITAFRSIKSPEAKLQVLYNFYDSDHDGKISRSEVADAMVVACGQALPKTQLEQVPFF